MESSYFSQTAAKSKSIDPTIFSPKGQIATYKHCQTACWLSASMIVCVYLISFTPSNIQSCITETMFIQIFYFSQFQFLFSLNCHRINHWSYLHGPCVCDGVGLWHMDLIIVDCILNVLFEQTWNLFTSFCVFLYFSQCLFTLYPQCVDICCSLCPQNTQRYVSVSCLLCM